MKRGKLIIGIAIALIVFLSACGGEKQTEEGNLDVLTTLSDTKDFGERMLKGRSGRSILP